MKRLPYFILAATVALATACSNEPPPDAGAPPARAPGSSEAGDMDYETQPGGPQPAPRPDDAGRGTFSFRPGAAPGDTEAVLELSYEGGLIKNPDPTPFVRVYPDGRVIVHYPAYMKKAGDYVVQLSEGELQQVLSNFADEYVLMIEPGELTELAAAARAGSATGIVADGDDHGVRTVVQIEADAFVPRGSDAPSMIDIRRRMEAPRVPRDAAVADPRFRPLREFSRGVDALEALAERADLRPVEQAGESKR